MTPISIPLTQNQVCLISPEDSDLAQHKWYASAYRVAHTTNLFIAMRAKEGVRMGKKKLTMHRVILSRMIGRELLRTEWVDHINGNTLDNRRENLRLATPSQNSCNRHKRINCTSQYKGVSWHKMTGKWIARIRINGKVFYLGVFATEESAYQAYCAAAIEFHGEFARLK